MRTVSHRRHYFACQEQATCSLARQSNLMKRGRDDGEGGLGTKVYVWGLPFSVDWAELKRIFKPAGTGDDLVLLARQECRAC